MTDGLLDDRWSGGARLGYTFVPYARLQQGTDDAPNPSELAIDVHLATVQAFVAAPTGTALDLQLPIGSLATRMLGGERTDTGSGDLELRVRQSLARWVPVVALGATLGVVLPTGQYVARSGAANVPPEATFLTLGRGVPWWLVELDASRAITTRVRVAAQLSGRGPLARASDDFAWGPETRATTSGRVTAIDRVAVAFATDLQWRGRASEPNPFDGGRVESANVGGWQLTISPAIEVALGDVVVTGGVRVPLYNDVVGNQLVPGIGGFVSVAYTRRLSSPRRSQVEPRRGQITVVDYWASWCEPCKVIEAELARAAWPDVQVIRVDASDLPASALPAGASGLPVVEVFDETGRRRALLTGEAAKGVVDVVDELRRSKGPRP
jgi:thiol-disulfide isomerase/thioredoxin